jgi:UDP-N-acetylglucosamine 2-epimerase (non-hydrolysing)
MAKKLLIAYGTRPEYIKIKPLLSKLKNYVLLFTGQHNDIVNSNYKYGMVLKIVDNGNRLDSIVKSILCNDKIFKNIDRVLVQGDTTTAMAIAMAAYHRQIPIIHLEAGLRTNNNKSPYPEEVSRRYIDSISDILFCATMNNAKNLIREKVNGQIYVTGNTGLDNLLKIKTTYKNTVYCTLHRRENINNIKAWFQALSKLAKQHTDLHFIFPVHPNPDITKNVKYLDKNIDVIDYINYDTSIRLISESKFIITDSGGVQEEASFLNKRAFICRKITERTECIGKNSVLCKTPEILVEKFEKYINKFVVNYNCPYGDGKASNSIAEVINGSSKR